MDGRKAIETMRKQGLTIPIIALTANALDHHREESLTAGASEFVTKPILRNDLYSKCCHYLGEPPASLPCIPFQ
jgi:CheY-like chemotaxis protein